MQHAETDCRLQTPSCSGKNSVFVGLGSNLGDSSACIAKAVDLIVNLPGITYVAASRVYSTEPQDMSRQPWFSNQVLQIECDSRWSPLKLLQALLAIEDAMGRLRKQRFGPRIIDLDLLLFGQRQMNSSELTLPHPRMHKRAFVLVPLLEIAPDLVIPGRGRAADVLQSLNHAVDELTIHQA